MERKGNNVSFGFQGVRCRADCESALRALCIQPDSQSGGSDKANAPWNPIEPKQLVIVFSLRQDSYGMITDQGKIIDNKFVMILFDLCKYELSS